MVAAVARPTILTDPGVLYIAPLASTLPAMTVVGGVFTDPWPAAWLQLGATEDGSQFSYQVNTQPILVAEFFDPIAYKTTDRSGSFAFSLASWGLSNYNRALNGGVAALTPVSGTGTTALYELTPPAPGNEARAMIGWESLDGSLRLVCKQTLQSGQVQSSFKKAPANAAIPCSFVFEIPADGTPPFKFSGTSLRA